MRARRTFPSDHLLGCRRANAGGKDAMLKVVVDDAECENSTAGLDEIVREGARRMLAAALEAEVDGYLAALADQRDEAGRRLVVRNGMLGGDRW